MAESKIVYVVTENPQDKTKGFWNRAGVAFDNKDGGFSLKLDMFPNVKLVALPHKATPPAVAQSA